MILFLLFSLALSFLLLRAVTPVGDSIIAHFNSDEQIFTGVITDTHCGTAAAHPDSDCIRRCVHSTPDARYALYDGHAVYVLSDQRTPEKFITRKVRVRGTLDKDRRILDVRAIDPA